MGRQLGILGGAGVQAVDVFFVLSGFVIAHVYVKRELDARNQGCATLAGASPWPHSRLRQVMA
ncbi:MAG: hypothetical protein DLM68_07565 [Hyphomicrobiales bacterium]|nr:MAG: hypothetical protein DLM68_07565 [Hyphomicrobiales bacterium]